jgi:CheY-like chemotaxis protein
VARLLLIDPDRRALVTLQKALREAGFTSVTAVPSGSFALTMVERERPDLVVSRVRIPDISGLDLCAIMRSDPALRGVRLLLLAEEPDEVPADHVSPAGESVLVGETDPARLVQAVQQLLAGGTVAAAAAPASAAARAVSRALRGSLGVMDLAEVTQAIALGTKSGQLVLTLAVGPGVIVFDRGRVVHAQFGRLRGEAAFAALLSAAHREGDGTFCFNPVTREADAPADQERTIDRSLGSLLLSTAAEIDEGGATVPDTTARRSGIG